MENYKLYKRVVQVKKLLADNPAIEDPCQRIDYSYGQDPGGVGRLTRVPFGDAQQLRFCQGELA